MEKHLLSTRAGVLLLAAQALFSGLAIGVIAGSLAAINKRSDWPTIGILAGAIACGAFWLWGLSWWKGLVERFAPGAPEGMPQSTEVRLYMTDTEGGIYRGSFINLPTDVDRLRQLAREVQSDPVLTYAKYGGRGRIYSRSEWENLRSALQKRGLVVRVGQTWELTRPGRAFMRALVDGKLSPTFES